MTYAGRLDPMASGLLLLLAGSEIKNKEKYLGLDKEYEFEILFGFATDTYDILGKVQQKPRRQRLRGKSVLEKLIKENLKFFRGKIKQTYPLYSSPTIKSARRGIQAEPRSREIVVQKLEFLKLRSVTPSVLFKNIEKRIKKVDGDFRQKEILSAWDKHLRMSTLRHFWIGSFKIRCSSGTYVRGVAHSLGEKMGVPTLAFSIKRTKIGKWKTRD